jgi:hypothetical protein
MDPSGRSSPGNARSAILRRAEEKIERQEWGRGSNWPDAIHSWALRKMEEELLLFLDRIDRPIPGGQ